MLCSDKRGVLYPFNPFHNTNPGATQMLSKGELDLLLNDQFNTIVQQRLEKSEIIRRDEEIRTKAQKGVVDAVLLQDILSSISSHTIVMKMDIEGYECKVRDLSLELR